MIVSIAVQVLAGLGKIMVKLVAAILAADFVAGLIHWAEDAYGNADTPILGKWIIQANLLHHKNPRAFVKKTWWGSSWDLLLFAAVVLAAAWFMGWLRWPLVVFAVISANANEIHKWAHRTPRENGKIITWLQRMWIVQGTRHHARHHTNPKNSNYCTVTNFLNPALDGMRFWEGCEFVLKHALGLQRRVDPTVTERRVKAIGRKKKDAVPLWGTASWFWMELKWRRIIPRPFRRGRLLRRARAWLRLPSSRA